MIQITTLWYRDEGLVCPGVINLHDNQPDNEDNLPDGDNEDDAKDDGKDCGDQIVDYRSHSDLVYYENQSEVRASKNYHDLAHLWI